MLIIFAINTAVVLTHNTIEHKFPLEEDKIDMSWIQSTIHIIH